MIDRRLLRKEPDTVRTAMERKGVTDVDLDELLAIDEEWR